MPKSRSSSISSNELFEELENNIEQGEGKNDSAFDWGAFREARLQQMADDMERTKSLQRQGGTDGWCHFTQIDSVGLAELYITISKEEFCIIHFSHPDFKRCAIMDKHLQTLAPKHPNTLFLRTSVDNAPFLVTRLGVKVLPCVISFINGNATDRLIGFEELGNDDSFSTAALEFRLKRSGVLPPAGYRKVTKLETLIPGMARADNSDEDHDSEGDERNLNTRRQKIIRSVRDNRRSRRGKAGDDSDDGWD
ncbi:hypothetical protein QFC22_000296 [Naganishia vaughanmartiniae]|uniref:Uncharacterized protein n=1 Tax=Naganishia vaughanmartiniae TaxID=1424756 RepID=A0ACC2XPY1_9TREE|nr:hypothetical protein QFC22_000296 [Naganishia vaughanmartiniae]